MLHFYPTTRKRIPSVNILKLVFILFLSSILETTAQAPPPVTYPKVARYVGVIHPLATFSKEGTTTNFDGYYVVGMPTGINI